MGNLCIKWLGAWDDEAVVWRAWVSGRRWQSSRLRCFVRAASSALYLADILLVSPTHHRVISRGCELHRVNVALCGGFTKILVASGNVTFESGQENSDYSSWVKGDPAKQVEDAEKEQAALWPHVSILSCFALILQWLLKKKKVRSERLQQNACKYSLLF